MKEVIPMRPIFSRFSRILAPATLALLAASPLLSGCSAWVTAEPPVVQGQAEVVWVDSPPVNIETYPHEYYAGADVYLVGGRWYRRSGARWVVYRSEPVELGRRRAVIERRVPGYAAPHRGKHHDRR